MENFIPSSGIALIEPIEKDTSLAFQYVPAKTKVLKGKILAMGNNVLTDYNAILEGGRYGQVGNTVYFLSYEGDYDNFMHDGKNYYVVKWQDFRGIVRE